MELVHEESLVVVEPWEAVRTAVDIGKVVVITEQRPHMDKGNMAYGPYELDIEEFLSSQHLFLLPHIMIFNIIQIIQQRRIIRQLQPPLPPRRHKNHRNLSQRTPQKLSLS